MDRVCQTYRHSSKSFVAFCQMKGIKGKKFKKFKFKILSLGGAISVFGSDFRHERKKMNLEHF